MQTELFMPGFISQTRASCSLLQNSSLRSKISPLGRLRAKQHSTWSQSQLCWTTS